MALTSLERDILQRLSSEPWASPPLFDHNLVARLVEAGYVQTENCLRGRCSTKSPRAGALPLPTADLPSPHTGG
jgi:hypothetical protein